MMSLLTAGTMPSPIITAQEVDDIIAIFDHDVDAIQTCTATFIADANDQLNALLAVSDISRTWDNTMAAYDNLMSKSDAALFLRVLHVLALVHSESSVRSAAMEGIVSLEDYFIDVQSNADLYAAITAYTQGNAQVESLSSAQQYFMNKVIDDLQRAGNHLPEVDKTTLKNIKKQIKSKGATFHKNVVGDLAAISILVKPDDLTGIDQSFIDTLEVQGRKVILVLDVPTYTLIMTQCSNTNVRKKAWQAVNNRAHPANDAILSDIVNDRDQLASLLGYESYAAYEIATEMAQTVTAVQAFLDDVYTRASVKEMQEFTMLTQSLPEGVSLTKKGMLNLWDIDYVKEQYKKTHYDVDQDALAQYFPLDAVLRKMNFFFNEFFNVSLRELSVRGLWSNDVRVFRVIDTHRSNIYIGYIILDLYTRDSKITSPCVCGVIPATIYNEQESQAVTVLMTNFEKPQSSSIKRLTHPEIRTLFYEFGKALYWLLARQDIAGQAGFNVKKDFVNMSGQLVQEWAWDNELLAITSDVLDIPFSESLTSTVAAVKNLTSGADLQHEIAIANISLNCFQKGSNKNLKNICDNAFQSYITHAEPATDCNAYASSNYLIDYGSRYYSKLWSKVFAADVLNTIKPTGLLDQEMGLKLRQSIIEKGGSQDPNDLLISFLGRTPNNESFFNGLGI